MRMRWEGHLVRMVGEKLGGETEGKRPLGIRSNRWENCTEMSLKWLGACT